MHLAVGDKIGVTIAFAEAVFLLSARLLAIDMRTSLLIFVLSYVSATVVGLAYTRSQNSRLDRRGQFGA